MKYQVLFVFSKQQQNLNKTHPLPIFGGHFRVSHIPLHRYPQLFLCMALITGYLVILQNPLSAASSLNPAVQTPPDNTVFMYQISGIIPETIIGLIFQITTVFMYQISGIFLEPL